MSGRVLVTYGSKYGATVGIAEKIGEVLRDSDLEVEVVAAGRAGDLTRYTAVVAGSGVYIGSWRKDAAGFLKANEATLATLPVWLFSSGPTGEGDPVELLKGWRFPEALRQTADKIKPRDIAVFGGLLDVKKLNPIEKFVLRQMKASMGDFRNWQAITAWAADIAKALAGNSTEDVRTT